MASNVGRFAYPVEYMYIYAIYMLYIVPTITGGFKLSTQIVLQI